MNDEALPLIPSKKEAVCTDIREVLRETFRDLDISPNLRRTSSDKEDKKGGEQPDSDHWKFKYVMESELINNYEDLLKNEYARKISRCPAPNVYRLRAPAPAPGHEPAASWRHTTGVLQRNPTGVLQRNPTGVLQRDHLVPTVPENSGGNTSLWVKNIMNRSSADLSALFVVQGNKMVHQQTLKFDDHNTEMSMSIGKLSLPPRLASLPSTCLPPPPEHVICMPPYLEFVNFTVGQTISQNLRVVNICKFEVRLSLRPPQRPELDIQLCGSRGLTVTSGAAVCIRVSFRARDVVHVRDELRVRASGGQDIRVPLLCYMTPPVLEILVPMAPSLWPTAHVPATELRVHRSGNECVLDLGAKLLGDVHCVDMMLHCFSEHAHFFVITEDAWQTYTVDCISPGGAVICNEFTLYPAHWRGGGGGESRGGGGSGGEGRGGGSGGSSVRGTACCRAATPGLHEAAFRILCSTAVCRTLTLVADTLHYRPEHITLAAHERDYSICSVSDQACEYFVDIGAGFPGIDLTTSIQLINHSTIQYTYRWQARAWEGCGCRELCDLEPGAPPCEACLGDLYETVVSHRHEWADCLFVQPSQGVMAPRSQLDVQIGARTAAHLGPQYACLVLILENIPVESIPHDYDPIIVASKEIDCNSIPGNEVCRRAVCSVAALQLEARGGVRAPRLLLEPRALQLAHSKRIKSVDLQLVTTQLTGSMPLTPVWSMPPCVRPPLPPATPLTPWIPSFTTVQLTLPIHDTQEDVITVSSPCGMSTSHCVVSCSSPPLAPSLRPARAWLGIHIPGSLVTATLLLTNDTCEHMYWSCEAVNWQGLEASRTPATCATCAACAACHQPQCACGAVQPARGELRCGDTQEIHYQIQLPMRDGLVCSLVQVRHSAASAAHAARAAARVAALVACRALASRGVLRVLPCAGEGGECKKCSLDESNHPPSLGSPLLRPSSALVLGRRTCYRLKVTNLTPLSTSLQWDNPIDGTDILKVRFNPKTISISGHSTANIQVVVEGLRACARRVYTYRAHVEHVAHVAPHVAHVAPHVAHVAPHVEHVAHVAPHVAHVAPHVAHVAPHVAHVAPHVAPLYLILDAAVSGLEVACDVQLGADENTKSILSMQLTQSELFPWSPKAPTTPQGIFAEHDRKRNTQNENICECKFKTVYIPPLKPAKDPNDSPSPEIITEPPPLTRVCKCFDCSKPILPLQEEPYCLQFIGLPLNTVWSRRITLRNTSCLTGRWSATVRRWPASRKKTIDGEVWSCPASAGVLAQCAPARGVLAARAAAELRVLVRADCWGCYYEQILIKIEELSPIILDVWVEAVGPALEFLIKPNHCGDEPPIVWLTSSDPERTLRARNTSRADLTVQAFVTVQHQHPQDELPFRLYFRFVDAPPPRKCPCDQSQSSFQSDTSYDTLSRTSTVISGEMATDIELYLAPDCGYEDDSDFQVEPRFQTVSAGGDISWQVRLQGEDPPEGRDPAVLMLRVLAIEDRGACWCRRESLPQRVLLRESLATPPGSLGPPAHPAPPAPPAPALQLSREHVHVRVCAIDLSATDVTRIRKHLVVRNTGRGRLHAFLNTTLPWSAVRGARRGACGCEVKRGTRGDLELWMPAQSCVELSLELALYPYNLTPDFQDSLQVEVSCSRYDPEKTLTNQLVISDDYNVLKTMPLTVQLEYPVICVTPSPVSLGVVCDGDKREAYFTVSHTSRMSSIHLVIEWVGCPDFKLQCTRLHLAPGEKQNVFVHYTGRWLHNSAAEGVATIRLAGSHPMLESWCRTKVKVHANPTRDKNLHY